MASRHTPVVPAPPQLATKVCCSAPPKVPSRPATPAAGWSRGEAGADGQGGVDRELGQQPASGPEPADDGPDPSVTAGRGEQRAGPGEQERARQRRDGRQLGPHRQLGEPHRGDQPEAERDPVERGRGELAPRGPAGHVAGGRVGDQLGDGALAVRPGVEDPDRDATAGELADQRADQAAGPACVAASVSAARASASRSGASTTSAPAASGSGGGRVPGGRPGRARRYPGEGRGPAGPEQPGQHRLGHGVRADADEHALPGRPRGGRDRQQARPGLFGRVDPAHAKGRKLAAQPRVGHARQDQRYRHAVLPAAQAAVTRA